MTCMEQSSETLFSEAIEIASPQDRAVYLDRACQDRPELRRQVEKLVQDHFRAKNFLESPAAQFTLTAAHPPIAEGPGSIIGPYKLLDQIGEGGMGVVFMAEQTRPVQRTVALKIIKPGMDTRQVIARFEAERQALAMMDHPNIARVLDVGATDSGRPYFVMDLVKGVPISAYCDQQHLPVRERLELVSAVCHAVQHAHQKGIIHRDLKPSNVLVAEYDGKPVPKIIDFGVAKATASKLTEKTMFTELGQLVGTVEYMSPEQARFNQLDVDTRSDIYSLGALVYELLTGSTPFGRKRLHAAAFDEMLRMIREEEPPKPSTRLSSCGALPSIAANRGLEPLKLNRLVQGELDWIVMKCLEKDRNRRYETASSLAADIEHYLLDEPVQACPPTATYRLHKFARRNKVALVTAAIVAASLILATAVSAWQVVLATQATRRATQETRKAEAATAREATLRRAAEARATVVQAKIHYDNKQFDEAEKLLNTIPADLLSPDSSHARMRRLLGKLDCFHERWEEAAANFSVLFQTNGMESRLTNSIDHLLHGPVLLMLGDTPAYEKFQEQATSRYLRTTNSTEAERICKICLLLPANESVMRRIDKLYEVAVRGPSDPTITEDEQIWASLSLAVVDYRRGDYRKAIEWCRPCVTSEKTGRTAAARAIVAMAHHQLHQDAEAQSALDLAHQANEQITSGIGPRSSVYYPDVVVLFDGLYAHVVLQEAEALINGRPLRPYTGYTAAEKELGDMYAQGMYVPQSDAEAVKWYRNAAVQGLVEAQVALARMYVTGRGVAKDPAEADKWLHKAVERADGLRLNNLAWKLVAEPSPELRDPQSAVMLAEHAVEKSPPVDGCWNTLGLAYCRAGDWYGALAALEKSMELRDGGDSFDWFFLAMAHHQLGHKEEARKWNEQAVEWMERNAPGHEELRRFRAEAAELLGVTDPYGSSVAPPADGIPGTDDPKSNSPLTPGP
jgi:serine/threonine protein kinase/TPR repeat protein